MNKTPRQLFINVNKRQQNKFVINNYINFISVNKKKKQPISEIKKQNNLRFRKPRNQVLKLKFEIEKLKQQLNSLKRNMGSRESDNLAAGE